MRCPERSAIGLGRRNCVHNAPTPYEIITKNIQTYLSIGNPHFNCAAGSNAPPPFPTSLSFEPTTTKLIQTSLLSARSLLPTQVDNTAQQPAQQPSAEAIGKELEMQLLFGEHVDPIAAVAPSTSVPATPTGRIQAGFLVAAVDESSDMRAAPPAQQAETSGESIRSLEGAVLAQKATGAPLMIVCPHFAAWELVKSAVSVATAHWGDSLAVDKKLILTGMHGGICQSLSCQVAMLEKGLVLCFDCFGRVEWLPGPEYYPSDEESAVRIAELARLGFADRLVISQGVSRRTHLSRYRCTSCRWFRNSLTCCSAAGL